MIRFSSSIIALAVAASVSVSTAKAADFAAPAFSWTGVYVGGTLGYGWPRDGGTLSCDSITITDGNAAGIAEGTNTRTDCAQYTNDYGYEPFQGEVFDGPKTGSTFTAFELPQTDYASLQGTSRDEQGGLIGGVILGGNLQMGNFVIGFEGDFVGTDVKSTSVSEFGHFGFDNENNAGSLGDGELDQFIGEGRISIRDKMDWNSTARMRAGYVLGEEDRWMVFGTVGLAVAQVSRSASTEYEGRTISNKCTASECGIDPARYEDQFYQAGYALGAGVSWAFTDNVIIGAEYLFTDYLNTGNKVSARFLGDDQDKRMQVEIEDNGFNSLHQARARILFLF